MPTYHSPPLNFSLTLELLMRVSIASQLCQPVYQCLFQTVLERCVINNIPDLTYTGKLHMWPWPCNMVLVGIKVAQLHEQL